MNDAVWRKRGEHPDCSFYECPQKLKSLIVWGAIGPKGWLSDHYWVKGPLNAHGTFYIEMLERMVNFSLKSILQYCLYDHVLSKIFVFLITNIFNYTLIQI